MPKMPPDPVILAVAQAPREAWLLRRVCHWQRYASVEHGGYTWVVKTQEEWAQETGLSLPQVRRAFNRLRRLGVVVNEQHMFKNRNQSFTRINSKYTGLLG